MGIFDFFKQKNTQTYTTETESIVQQPNNVAQNETTKNKTNENEDTSASEVKPPVFEDFVITRVRSYVAGTKYENRNKNLKKIMDEFRELGLFYSRFENLTNREIIDSYYDEPVYEFSTETYPIIKIEFENDNEFDENAIKVFVGLDDDNIIQSGYVKKSKNKKIRELAAEYPFIIGGIITGGKYKIVEYDEYGDEKVRTKTSDYGVEIVFTFFKDGGKELLGAGHQLYDMRE